MRCLLVLLLLTGSAWAGEATIVWHYFHAPGCRLCVETTAAVRAAAAGDPQIQVRHRPTDAVEEVQALFTMLGERGWPPETRVPPLVLIVGDAVVAGGEAIIEEVPRLAASGPRLLVARAVTPGTAPGLGFWVITLAALADGINPCVFAGIVFLVSALSLSGRERRVVMLVGGGFAAGVVLAYLALGLLLRQLLLQLSAYRWLADGIHVLALGLCLCGALISAFDAVQFWRGRPPGAMIGKLSPRLRHRINTWLRGATRARALVPAAFLAGLVVALLEAGCTGQVYVPIIVGLLEEAPLPALAWLVWYNLIFILPLLVILALTWIGLSSRQLQHFGERHWGWFKAILAGSFLALAWWMLR